MVMAGGDEVSMVMAGGDEVPMVMTGPPSHLRMVVMRYPW